MKKALIILSVIAIVIVAIAIIFKKQILSLFETASKEKEPEYVPQERGTLFEGSEASGEVFKSNVNNPLNIRANAANGWKGKTTKYGDTFESFDTIVNGIRAGIKTLKTYFRDHGLNTVEKIISRWSPNTENDTSGYIQYVSKQTGFLPEQPIEPTMSNLYMLITAMAKMENSYGVKYEDYEEAWNSI